MILLSACLEKKVAKDDPLFSLMQETGVDFRNDLTTTEDLNPYTYRNFYNGGGVALGDINNDGLLDIYFSGNQVDNKLYLNLGDWKFKDITESANVACSGNWSTGVTFVDINADGYLDLYVCKAGPPGGTNRNNQLFLNKGDLTFEDVSKEYGLDIQGLSIHSAFFDFDRDGDLDCYLLSNSIRSVGNFDLIRDQREVPDPEGNKFLINENGVFRDATEELGIYSSKIGYGLGITLSDFNLDGWTDIFISNDFFEKDYLYINQKGKKFIEAGEAYFQCFSLGSMGADAADLNNDLLPDLFVTEMLPIDNERKKTKMIYDSWDKYQSTVDKGYYHQVPRNALQRNMGKAGFLEISRDANVAGTNWSWASLLCDLDNDGLKDIFVSNGIGKDLLDRDYLAYMADGQVVRNMMKEKDQVMEQLVDIMPSEKTTNIVYKNIEGLEFQNVTKDWGLNVPSFSNGSAYGDLDNDGDLDLIVSNVDDNASLFKNNTDTSLSRFVIFDLIGSQKNTQALGSKVEVFTDGETRMLELFPSRGFQSSVGHRLHFGIGSHQIIDSIIVYWPTGVIEKKYNLRSNQVHILKETESANRNNNIHPESVSTPLEVVHVFSESSKVQSYNEFNRERLLPKMTSYQTPAIAVADINHDGSDDLFYGGGYNQPSAMFVSNGDIENLDYNQLPFDALIRETVTEANWVDFDADGDMDLYVGIGGRVFSQYSQEYNDYIYTNGGGASFLEKPIRVMTEKPVSTGSAVMYDVNKDDQKDVIMAHRADIQSYGVSKGLSVYSKDAEQWSKMVEAQINDLGMVTDMAVGDLNGDGDDELIVAGEWRPIRIFTMPGNGQLIEKTSEYFTKANSGFWQTIALEDIDNDGDLDLIGGNIGTNGFLHKKDRMFVADFDQNGSTEQLLCYKEDGKYYLKHDFDELVSQLPSLRRAITLYKDYASSSMTDLFGEEALKRSVQYDMEETRTSVWMNERGKFEFMQLPKELQYSSVHAIEVMDVNVDGEKDILFGGNDYKIKPQYGRNDASKGWICYGEKDDNGNYGIAEIVSMNLDGEIRSIKQFNVNHFIIATSDMSIKLYRVKE